MQRTQWFGMLLFCLSSELYAFILNSFNLLPLTHWRISATFAALRCKAHAQPGVPAGAVESARDGEDQSQNSGRTGNQSGDSNTLLLPSGPGGKPANEACASSLNEMVKLGSAVKRQPPCAVNGTRVTTAHHVDLTFNDWLLLLIIIM